MVWIFGWFIFLSVAYSRIYSGRHSLDQILIGSMYGYVVYHYSWYYYMPLIFKSDISPDSDHFLQAVNSVIMTITMTGVAMALYFQVEGSDFIKPEWLEVSKIICPNLRMTHLYHYNSVAGVGYFGYYLSFYCYKYTRFYRKKPLRFSFEEGDIETQSTTIETVIRMALLVASDHLLSIEIPNRIYGTKNIGMWADYFFKKMLVMVALVLIMMSDRLDRFFKSIFRPEVLK